MAVYDEAAQWYDRLWTARRDYAADATTITRLVRRHHPHAHTLLDIGVATGEHLRHLCADFACTGLDVSPRLLELAEQKLGSQVTLHRADMTSFELTQRFDAIICLWGTIAYAGSVDGLADVARRMATHLEGGGIVVVEPWLTPDLFDDPGMTTVTTDRDRDPVLTVVTATSRRGRVATLRRLYAAASPDRIDTVEEHHELGLFTSAEYRGVFEDAGFVVEWQSPGLTGRGLLIGVR